MRADDPPAYDELYEPLQARRAAADVDALVAMELEGPMIMLPNTSGTTGYECQQDAVRCEQRAGAAAMRAMSAEPKPRAILVTLATIALLGAAAAQEGPSFSGTVTDWDRGRADLVMHSAAQGQPPLRLDDDQVVLGAIEPDGTFAFQLPNEVSDTSLVPIVTEIGDCVGLTADPEGVNFYPLDVIVYDEDGRLLGLLFPVSPGAEVGPVVPGYSVLMGWTDRAVHVEGSCVDERRRVEEDYDASVQPGWYLLVQRFDDHPTRDGWRIDRWRQEPMPEDVEWVLQTPF